MNLGGMREIIVGCGLLGVRSWVRLQLAGSGCGFQDGPWIAWCTSSHTCRRLTPLALIQYQYNTKMPFYAVRRGFQPGVYLTWDECQAQVNGFKGAQFKKFSTHEEAEAFKLGGSGPSSVPHPTLGRPKGSASSTKSSSGGKAPSSGGNRAARAAPYQKPERSHGKSPTDSEPTAAAATVAETAGESEPDAGSMTQGIANIRSELAALKEQVARHVAGGTDSPTEKKDASGDASTTSTAPAPDQFVVDADGFLNVWTDGACGFNGCHGARAGVGVWFNSGHPLNVSAPVDGPATNNNAEIQAAWVALELAGASGHKRVLIHTDSQFVINCATRWMAKWQKNDWTLSSGGPVKNRTQLEALARAMEGVEVKWNHVAGHSGVAGNEGADRLAVAGAARYKPPPSNE